MLLRYIAVAPRFGRLVEAAMTHQHPNTHKQHHIGRGGLTQMSALARLGIVLPAIGLVWLVLWLLVRS